MGESLKNILIIKPSSLGDIVLALPALAALRRSFPGAKISWLIRPEFAGLIESHPDLTDTIIFDRKLLGKAWYNLHAFASLVSLVRRLRTAGFDAVVDLQGLFRTAVLGWLTGCKKRFGMADVREFAHIFYTHKIVRNPQLVHMVDCYLEIVRAMGADACGAQFVLPVDPLAAERVDKLLSANNIEPGRYAVLVIGSAHTDKCWPVERFAKLADKIHTGFGLSIVVTGTKSERDIAGKLQEFCSVPVTDFAGKTNLVELVALLKSAAVVISNDTGPGHIAAALSLPMVMIFGYSNPCRVAPYENRSGIAAVEPENRGTGPDSPDARHNIKKVSFEQVYEKVCRQLESR